MPPSIVAREHHSLTGFVFYPGKKLTCQAVSGVNMDFYHFGPVPSPDVWILEFGLKTGNNLSHRDHLLGCWTPELNSLKIGKIDPFSFRSPCYNRKQFISFAIHLGVEKLALKELGKFVNLLICVPLTCYGQINPVYISEIIVYNRRVGPRGSWLWASFTLRRSSSWIFHSLASKSRESMREISTSLFNPLVFLDRQLN